MLKDATTGMIAGATRAACVLTAILLAFSLAFTLSPATAEAAATTKVKAACTATASKSSTKTLVLARNHSTKISASKTGDQRRWSSSNPKVVKVEPAGRYSARLTAIAPGKATITAKNSRGTLTCKVTVTGLTQREASVGLFGTGKLTFKGHKVAKAKKWKTSDSKCVKVSSKGVLTPVATGKAIITCTDNRGAKHKCVVTVKKPAITCKVAFQRYLFKNFKFTNKSGKTITLNTNVHYFSKSKATFPSCIVDTSTSAGFLAKSPLVAKDRTTTTFFGQTKEVANFTDAGGAYIKLGFNIGKTRYLASFSPITGKLLACSRR